MSFNPGNFGKEKEDINAQFAALKGDLSMEEAQLWLGKYMQANLGICWTYLTGMNLFPEQIIKLKMMFERDFVLDISGRGGAKTFGGAAFTLLYGTFNPGTRIVILGPAFKQAKLVMKKIIDVAEDPGAKMLRQYFDTKNSKHVRRGTDEWEFNIGKTKAMAYPLGAGGKLRGIRADVLIIDEFLEMPKEVIEDVITPFILVNKDPVRRKEIMDIENELIKKGEMTENERTRFKNPKIIGLSSASFQFEYLYERFNQYMNMILKEENKNSEITYGIINFSCEIISEGLLNRALIENQRKILSESSFMREFMAQFPNDSGGYFKLDKLLACKCEKNPIIELKGEPGAEYILGIDPNFKDQANSDHFAMCLLKLAENRRTWVQVHTFAMAESALRTTSEYLYYLLTHFNIVYIIGDDSGTGRFLEHCNDSALFISAGIKLKPIEGDFALADSIEYDKKIREVRNNYNKQDYRIVHYQGFNASKFIPNANAYLQASIGHQRLKFAAQPLNELYEQLIKTKLPLDKIKFESKNNYENDLEKIIEFIDNQINLIKLTIEECALIEMNPTSTGQQSFDLPKSMRSQEGASKPRKDSYTALLLANWGCKCYQEIMTAPPEEETSTFTPIWVR